MKIRIRNVFLALLSFSPAYAATLVWDGGGSDPGDLGIANNWNPDAAPNVATPDTLQWNGTVAGPLALFYTVTNATLGGAAGNPGLNLDIAAGQTSSLTLDSGTHTGSLRMNNVTIDAAAGAFSLGNSANAFNVTLGGAGGQTHTWTNQSANTATVNSDVNFGVGGGGTHTLALAGSGNWQINKAFAPLANGLNLLKIGTGTATLNAGATLTGNNTNSYLPGTALGPFLVREGNLVFNGDTYSITGEAVVGGVVTNGGAGQNAKWRIDAGTVNVTAYLSLCRGNGVGAVSSDLELNNASTITAANFSGGFNGGSALNTPKGSIVLNNTSSMTITANGVFNLAESAGSNVAVTLNNSAQLNNPGTGAKTIGNAGIGSVTLNDSSSLTFGAATTIIGSIGGNGTLNLHSSGTTTLGALTYVGYRTGIGSMTQSAGIWNNTGEVRIGGSDTNGTGLNGTGALTFNGGTANLGALTVARGNNNQNTVSGTVTINAGAIVNNQDDLILGFAGNNNLGKLTLAGGTLTVGTLATKWMQVGKWDTSKGQFDISSGNLNLYNSSALKMNADGTVGANVINQTGGSITFYSNAGTTVGGTGDLDLQRAGAAASNNTYHLSGGTLTVPRVVSTATTGTRTFNFNGGTLQATSTNATYFNLGAGAARANVRNGGAIIHSNGMDIGIPQALLHSNIADDLAIDGGLTKQGSGALTVSGTNSYTGPTLVSGGTLSLGASGVINTSSSLTINGSGAKFTQSTLSSFTPPVTLTQGTYESNGLIKSLTVASDVSNTINPGAGTANSMIVEDAVTFAGAATINLRANGGFMDRFIDVYSSSSMVLTTPGDGAVNGQIVLNVSNIGTWSGGTDYPLIKYGTFSGTLDDFVLGTVSGLSPRQTASLINTGSSIALRITGDSLRWTGANNSQWTITPLDPNFNWVLPSSSTNADFITGDVVLFDDSASNFAVSIDANVTPGSTVFDNTTLYTISSSGSFGIAGGTLVKTNTGTVIFRTNNTFTGTTTINAGTLQLGDGTTDGSIALSSQITNLGNLVFMTSGAQSVSNPITGSGNLTMSGTGILTLTSANDYTGNTTLNSGTLNLNHASAIGSTTAGTLVINGGVLDNTSTAAITTTIAKAQSWVGNFSVTGTKDLNFNGGVVTLSGGGSRVVNIAAGTLSTGRLVSTDGTGLSLTGAGVLSITTNAVSNINGPLAVGAGSTLRYNTGAAAGTTNDFVTTGLSGTGTVENGGGAERWFFLNNATDQVFDGVMQNGGAGNLGFNKEGVGSFQFSAMQSYTGRTTIRNGGFIASVLADSGVASSIGAGTELYLGEGFGTQAGSGTLIYAGTDVTVNRGFNVSCTAGNSGIIDTAANLTFTGVVAADDTGGFIKRGAGILTLSNASTTQKLSNGTNGGTSVYGLNVANGKLWLKNGTFTSAGEVVVGGQLLTGGNYTAAALEISQGSTITTPNWFSIGRGHGTTGLTSVVTVDSASLIQTGAANGIAMGYNAGVAGYNAVQSLIIKGTGVVTVAGFLNCGENPGADSSVTLQNSATLNLNNATQNNKSIGVLGKGTLTITSGLLNATTSGFSIGRDSTGDGTVNLDGGIIDTGSIIGGNGTATLRLNGGNLRANAASATFLNNLDTVSVEAGGAVIDSQTYAITVQALTAGVGAGGLTKNGSGILTLTGENTYIGNSTVSAGGLTLASGGSMKFVIGADTVSNRITGLGAATLEGAFSFDLTGASMADNNHWVIVDTTTKSFAASFSVTGFDDADLDNKWTKIDGANTWTFDEATGELSLKVSAGFSSWILGFGLAEADRDLTDDVDQDGYNNLMEYMLGGNPAVGNVNIAPTGAKAGGDFLLTFLRNDVALAAGDVVLSLEYGNDLDGWTSVVIPAGDSTVGGVAFDVTDGTPNDSITATVPTAAATKFFVRLKAVK